MANLTDMVCAYCGEGDKLQNKFFVYCGHCDNEVDVVPDGDYDGAPCCAESLTGECACGMPRADND